MYCAKELWNRDLLHAHVKRGSGVTPISHSIARHEMNLSRIHEKKEKEMAFLAQNFNWAKSCSVERRR